MNTDTGHPINLAKINIFKSASEWCVWVPIPPEINRLPHIPGPYGETFWPSFGEACEFVDHVVRLGEVEMATRDIAGIVGRKTMGIDCTEDESCVILRYFDIAHPDTVGSAVAALFPLELDQWWTEREDGQR